MIDYNNTPFYLFDIDILKNRINYLNNTMPSNVSLCFAIKANPFIIKEISDLIEKYEICSFGEWNIAKNLGISSKKMVISGIYKDFDSINYITSFYEEGEVFTAESLNQVALLDKISKEKNIKLEVILRLTSSNQFGMSEEDICLVLKNEEKYSHLNFVGIQYFSGTQKRLAKRIIKELIYVDSFLDKLENDLGFKSKVLEFGPGFPVMYFEGEEFDENSYLKEISSAIKSLKYQGPITMEIGRSIAASCGSYYTKVVDKKRNNAGNFAVLDGGMNHLVYYGQMMAMKKPFFDILPKKQGLAEDWNLVGALCTINDIVVKNISVINLDIGDIFIFKNTGAYCVTEGISLFLSRDLPKVYFKVNNEVKLVRDNAHIYKLNMPYKGGEIRWKD